VLKFKNKFGSLRVNCGPFKTLFNIVTPFTSEFSEVLQYFSPNAVDIASTGLLLSFWYVDTLGYYTVLCHRLVALSACGEHTSAGEGWGFGFGFRGLADTIGEAVIGPSMWWPHFLCTLPPPLPLRAAISRPFPQPYIADTREIPQISLVALPAASQHCILCWAPLLYRALSNREKQHWSLIRRWITSNWWNKSNAMEHRSAVAFGTRQPQARMVKPLQWPTVGLFEYNSSSLREIGSTL
jgi:hypothetical protein